MSGDCLDKLRTLPDESVHCCVTSPPYWGLRDYGVAGQLGLEATPKEYVAKMVEVFREVKRVLREDGTLWVNLGDSYASKFACDRRSKIGNGSPDQSCLRPNRLVGGLKEKDLVGIPWSVAFALRDDGWYLRSDIIWNKPNPMPESVTDRPTKAHEYLFLMTKSERYWYDAEAIKEQAVIGWNGSSFTDQTDFERHPNTGKKPRLFGAAKQNGTFRQDVGNKFIDNGWRNKRSVWTVPTAPYSEAHFATFPPDLIKPCIMAGCPVGGTVLDPFGGSGTTGMVALELGRKAILIELNPEYCRLIEQRCNVTFGLPLVCA